MSKTPIVWFCLLLSDSHVVSGMRGSLDVEHELTVKEIKFYEYINAEKAVVKQSGVEVGGQREEIAAQAYTTWKEMVPNLGYIVIESENRSGHIIGIDDEKHIFPYLQTLCQVLEDENSYIFKFVERYEPRSEFTREYFKHIISIIEGEPSDKLSEADLTKLRKILYGTERSQTDDFGPSGHREFSAETQNLDVELETGEDNISV